MAIDGKRIAEEIIVRLAQLPRPGKFFGAVLVGDDAASWNFLKQKEKTAKELGIDFRLYRLPAEIATDALRREIRKLSEPKQCGGFIVQLPLPAGVNRHYALNAIPKEKDPDCLSEAALGAFYTGRSAVMPPSVAAVEAILPLRPGSDRPLRDLRAALIGAGFLIGKPVGFWLQSKVSELTVFDSKVPDLEERLGEVDIVVSGAGKAHLFSAKHLKERSLVIDFGFNRSEDGKIVGDFNPITGLEGVSVADEKGIAYTKTPGGTGPILVSKLFENFYALNAPS